MKDNNKEKDIFEMAAEEAIANSDNEISIIEQAKYIAKNKNWSDVESFIDKEGSDRLLNIMENASDREFVSIYFKLLEYVKPKIMRNENKNHNTNIDVNLKIEKAVDFDAEVMKNILKNE